MKNGSKTDVLIRRLTELAEWADANEWEAPIDLGDTIREAVEELKKTTALVAAEHKREDEQ